MATGTCAHQLVLPAHVAPEALVVHRLPRQASQHRVLDAKHDSQALSPLCRNRGSRAIASRHLTRTQQRGEQRLAHLAYAPLGLVRQPSAGPGGRQHRILQSPRRASSEPAFTLTTADASPAGDATISTLNVPDTRPGPIASSITVTAPARSRGSPAGASPGGTGRCTSGTNGSLTPPGGCPAGGGLSGTRGPPGEATARAVSFAATISANCPGA